VERLAGKVAIVTGASRGIGRACGLELAAEGAAVVVAAREAGRLNELVEEISGRGGAALAVAGDVGDRVVAESVVRSAVDRFGRLDALVLAAQSTGSEACLEAYPVADVEGALHSGLFGSLHVMQAAFSHLRDAGDSSIVTFGDPDAVVGEPGRLATNVAKEAIRALTRTAAREWGRYGIRVNAVNPTVHSERVDAELEAAPDLEAWLATQIPGGRLGDARDVARTVVFLVSADAAMLTGSTVAVDGGRAMYA
jgi:NAD(P)-dependent dehydrogenase (short-subunit alcohol dehydrogenase family)